MTKSNNIINELFNRGTGLMIIEVRYSNPNGDPDVESDPRTIDTNGRGLMSPVSFKRKLRDLVEDKEGPVWQNVMSVFPQIFSTNGDYKYDILEKRGRDLKLIGKMNAETFIKEFWDARVFGNTILEAIKGVKDTGEGKDHFISTGVVQFGPGISIAPIEVERLTMTNKSGVQEGKDRGMAPLGWRVVRHAVYAMPFFVNPMMARKSGCRLIDIDIMKFIIPHAYRCTASAVRPFVEIIHAWYAEHKSPLGSCPDSLIIDLLTPKKTKGEDKDPSTSIKDYDPIPDKLPQDIHDRLKNFEDLCGKQWG